MVRSQQLFTNGQRAPIQSLRRRIVMLDEIYTSEIVQNGRHVRMVRPQCLFASGERPAQQPACSA